MLATTQRFRPLPDRGPLRPLFITTSMPVGGAETLLVNLVKRMDPERFLPEVCCLKEAGPLGEVLAKKFPVHSNLLKNKFDLRVLPRLRSLIRARRIDAVITVGAGDKMFWGRLAARLERLPVVLSALHSTGWPDTIGRLNRLLTPITDTFVAVADAHGDYLVQVERFPKEKVCVIPNGIDVERFRPRRTARQQLREELGLDETTPICGIVAALRPEKNHALFLEAAKLVLNQIPNAHFVIVGDGPERAGLEQLAQRTGIDERVHFLGSRDDVADVLAALDVFSLTSLMEANPVSILEALATEVPVVATDVGSVSSTVRPDETGFLAPAGDAAAIATSWSKLFAHPERRRAMGSAGRRLVIETSSLDRMVDGYQQLIHDIYTTKHPSRVCNEPLPEPLRP